MNKTKKYLIFFLLSLLLSFGVSEFLILNGKIKVSIPSNYQPYEAKPSEVVVSFYGGLGNNMFQYAAGLSYAKQHNKSLKINGNFKNFSRTFFISENDHVKGRPDSKDSYIERRAVLEFRDAKNDPSFQYLDGYFQDENIFKEHRDLILKVFKFKNELTPKNKVLADQIKSINSVSVHIRRGDYLVACYNDILSNYYYNHAMDYIASKVENPHFYIFSDDIEWVKKNLRIKYPHTFVDNNREKESADQDMHLMSLCKHNIIANSTFSWWGAWLNQNPEKIVLVPRVWLTGTNAKKDTKNVIPEDWIRIKEKADIGILKIGKFTDEEKKIMNKYFLPFDRKKYFEYETNLDVLNDVEQLEQLDYIFLVQKEVVLTQEINYKVVPDMKEKYLVYNIQKQDFEETTNNSFDVLSFKGNQVKDFFKKK